MATIADLVAKLKLRSNIDPGERLSPSAASLDDLLAAIIANAITQHNSTYTVASLPPAEEMLILLLAQIEVAYLRAEHFVNIAPVQSGGQAFTNNADSPFNKNLKLAQSLYDRYTTIVQQMGLASGAKDVIVQTTTYKQSDRLDRLFPYFNVPAAPAAIVRATAQSSTEILIEWDYTPVDYFYRYFIFWSLTPGIYVDWNAVGVMTVPRIKSSASLLYASYDQTQNAVLGQDFPADSDVYLTLVIVTQQNKYTYSDEVYVHTPAS